MEAMEEDESVLHHGGVIFGMVTEKLKRFPLNSARAKKIFDKYFKKGSPPENWESTSEAKNAIADLIFQTYRKIKRDNRGVIPDLDDVFKRIISIPDESGKADNFTINEGSKGAEVNSGHAFGQVYQNGQFQNQNSSSHQRGHNGHTNTGDLASPGLQTYIATPTHNRTTRNKPAPHLTPVVTTPAAVLRPKPKRVEDDNFKPVLPSRAAFSQQLYQSVEEFEFREYVNKCLEEAQAHNQLSTASNNGDDLKSAAEVVTFAGEMGARNRLPDELNQARLDNIELPNIPTPYKGQLSPFRGKDPMDLQLKPTQSMMVPEADMEENSYPQKDIPLLRAMSESNQRGASPLAFPHSPLFTQDLGSQNRPSGGFKLFQPGTKLQNGTTAQSAGFQMASNMTLPRVGGAMLAVGFAENRSPRQNLMHMSHAAVQFPLFNGGLPPFMLDSARGSLNNSSSKTRPAAVVPQDDVLEASLQAKNP